MIQTVFAETPLGTIGGQGQQGLGPFAGITDAVQGLQAVTSVVSSVIGVMTVAAGIWFLFNLLSGGFQWISAGGDKNALTQAQQRIQNAFIGLIIVVAGWTLLALAGRFLGFDILLNSPTNIINQITPRRF